MKVFTSKTQKVGKLGEDIVAMFLVKQGFEIVERNYTKKWGEIDVIARDVSRETPKIHFIEVKSIACNLIETPEPWKETKLYRPEENLHPKKLQRLKTTLQIYLVSFNKRHEVISKRHEIGGDEGIAWQFDLYVVYVDAVNKKGKIKPIYNIIL